MRSTGASSYCSMSRQALESSTVLHELERALARQDKIGRRGSVIPILLDAVDVRELPRELAEIQWLDLTGAPLDERLSELIRLLKTIPTE